EPPLQPLPLRQPSARLCLPPFGRLPRHEFLPLWRITYRRDAATFLFGQADLSASAEPCRISAGQGPAAFARGNATAPACARDAMTIVVPDFRTFSYG